MSQEKLVFDFNFSSLSTKNYCIGFKQYPKSFFKIAHNRVIYTFQLNPIWDGGDENIPPTSIFLIIFEPLQLWQPNFVSFIKI